MLSIVLSASSLLPPSAGRSALGSGAVTRFAVRTPTMTLMTDMQAQMELLQRELDVAKAALLSLSPAPAQQNEVASRPMAFGGTAVGVVEPTGGGVMAAGSSQGAAVTEDAAAVVARAQAMMEEAMTAAQEITTKASVAVDSAIGTRRLSGIGMGTPTARYWYACAPHLKRIPRTTRSPLKTSLNHPKPPENHPKPP